MRTFIWGRKTLPGTNLLKFKNTTKYLTEIKKLSKSFTIANVHFKENLGIQKLSWPTALLKPTKFQIKTLNRFLQNLLNPYLISLHTLQLTFTCLLLLFFSCGKRRVTSDSFYFFLSLVKDLKIWVHIHTGHVRNSKCCAILLALFAVSCCWLKHVCITFYSVTCLPILFDNDHKKRSNLVVIRLVPLGLIVGNKSINSVFTFTPKSIIK